AGERYWRAIWAAGSTAERETAWAALTGRVGPARAAWVSRALTPANTPAPGADPVFPTLAQQASRWTRPPLAQALPDQWIALAYRGGARIAEAHGDPIIRPLAAGLSPVDSAGTADPDMQWMVDFTAARNAGMGFVMDLTAAGPGAIDLLLVTGVRGSE